MRTISENDGARYDAARAIARWETDGGALGKAPYRGRRRIVGHTAHVHYSSTVEQGSDDDEAASSGDRNL